MSRLLHWNPVAPFEFANADATEFAQIWLIIGMVGLVAERHLPKASPFR